MRKSPIDPRVTRKSVTPASFFALFGALIALAIGQTFIVVIYFGSDIIPTKLLGALMIYWAVVALAFSLWTAFKIRKRYEQPIRTMGEVSQRVASGDFTARLEVSSKKGIDYLDAIFLDFNKMVDELAGIEMLKDDFVSNVSHEFKTPLSVIQNYATLLQSDFLSEEERKEYSRTVFGAAEQLSVLVSNILKLSKLENQSILTLPKPYDLCDQLEDCVLNFADKLEQNQIDFSIDTEDSASILADKGMMEIVWNNLLSNAIKFTPRGGAITLQQTSDGEFVTVTISDTGYGMDPETAKRCFDKFFRGELSRGGEGNGLGLALVKRVIDLIGGEISVSSVLKRGTVFTVKIKKCIK